jgi:alpha-beta hydrolase superfamily lysophospholipase
VLKDVENFVQKVKNLYQNIPLFMVGDGVGCLLVVNFLKNKKSLPFSGIIFTGPSFGQPKRSKILSKLS